MPKIKTISRNEEDFTRERSLDNFKVFKNTDPKLHPFAQQREYVRTLNAVKTDNLFAKPLVGHMDGHADAISRMNTVPNNLKLLLSGAADGEVRVWNLIKRRSLWSSKNAHRGFIRGLVCDPRGKTFLSCSSDKTVKMWKLNRNNADDDSDSESDEDEEEDMGEDIVRPLNTFVGDRAFNCMDHHWSNDMFATGSDQIAVWDVRRSEPIHTFSWGCDTIYNTKFNRVETNVLASTASDRNITMYDIRAKTPLHKVVMKMSSNALCWNPQEAFNFTVANEDHNLYTFDMRRLSSALKIHEDHVSAVMSIDYAPTGLEFVSGSYDRSVRIFNAKAGHSREIYSASRMQRVFSVKYTADNKYVLSGSDDTNIRMWKARRSERLGTMLPRERAQFNYNNKLKAKFAHAPEIKRIARNRHVPKQIKKARDLKHQQRKSATTKLARVRAHRKAGAIPYKSKRKKPIRYQEE